MLNLSRIFHSQSRKERVCKTEWPCTLASRGKRHTRAVLWAFQGLHSRRQSWFLPELFDQNRRTRQVLSLKHLNLWDWLSSHFAYVSVDSAGIEPLTFKCCRGLGPRRQRSLRLQRLLHQGDFQFHLQILKLDRRFSLMCWIQFRQVPVLLLPWFLPE